MLREIQERMRMVKKGMKVRNTTKVTAEVTEEMFAQFEGEVIHPAYSTVSMVYHMEWASRKLLIPHLEEGEEGMGSAVTVKHIAPSGLGTKVEVTATVCEVTDREVITEVFLTNEYGVIGKGEVKQAILPKEKIETKLAEQTASKAQTRNKNTGGNEG